MTRRHVASLLLATTLGGCTFFVDTGKLDPLKDSTGFARAYGDQLVKYINICSNYSAPYGELFINYFLLFQLDQQVRSNQAGLQGFDKAAAQACINALANLSCSSGLPPECDPAKVMPPAVAIGGACKADTECAAPAVGCFYPVAAPTCPGTCRQLGGLNAQCGGPANLPGCAAGSWCSGATSLVAGTCVAGLYQGQDCHYPAACASGLFCRYDFSVSPYTALCQYLVPISSSCANGYICVDGAYCDTGSVCRAKIAIGSSCAGGLTCVDTGYCDPSSSVCKVNPTSPSPVGGSCTYPAYCDYGNAYCDTGTHLCHAYLAAGTSCTSGSQCGIRAFCNPGGTCQKYADVGGVCHTGANECLLGLYCDAPGSSPSGTAGTCKAAQLGGTCGAVNTGENADCLSGQCNASSGAGTCVAWVELGGNCTTLSCDPTQYLTCTSGTCVSDNSCHP